VAGERPRTGEVRARAQLRKNTPLRVEIERPRAAAAGHLQDRWPARELDARGRGFIVAGKSFERRRVDAAA
jgi:hypothetical protein